MTDRPIIFSAPMVRALLEGRKTQTRRYAWIERKEGEWKGRDVVRAVPTIWRVVQPGDRLWVRENFNTFGGGDPGVLVWASDWREGAKARGLDNIPDTEPKWRPSIHMPRWASRLTLTVTEVRHQPLQDIGADDAEAEGLKAVTKDGKLIKYGIPDNDGLPGTDDYGWPWHDWRMSPVDAFQRLWCSLHGADSWGPNPEVVALTFTVAQRNIDKNEEEAA